MLLWKYRCGPGVAEHDSWGAYFYPLNLRRVMICLSGIVTLHLLSNNLVVYGNTHCSTLSLMYLCMPDGLFAGACNRCDRSNAPTSWNNYQPMMHLTSPEGGVSAVHEFDSSIRLQASSAWVLQGWLQYLSKGRLVSGSVAYLGSAGLKCLTTAGSQNACILSPS